MCLDLNLLTSSWYFLIFQELKDILRLENTPLVISNYKKQYEKGVLFHCQIMVHTLKATYYWKLYLMDDELHCMQGAQW